jgi:DnaJ-domain-containing protein 1
MTDYFALLHEQRRPWIDPDSLKQKFFALSSANHPDHLHGASEAERQVANQRSIEINAAYACLREPKTRLLHLLELERGGKPKEIERAPAEMTELFFKVGSLLRETDNFLRDKAKVSSPLLKVKSFEKGMTWTEELQRLQQSIESRRQALFAELELMNAAWVSAPEVGNPTRSSVLPLNRMEEVYRQLSYFHRWIGQIHERLTELSI